LLQFGEYYHVDMTPIVYQTLM